MMRHIGTGIVMRAIFFNFFKLVVFACAAVAANQRPAAAADLGIVPRGGAVLGSCAEVALVCENGRQYPLCPIAVTLSGDIVTATLQMGSHPTYVRLVPMGVGYRYAGRGVWFDGLRENAVLSFGNYNSIACTVTTQ